jgi:hypothetical protein
MCLSASLAANRGNETDMITVAPETERLARLVAIRSGTTPEQVLKEAIEAHARGVGIIAPTGDQLLSAKPSLDRMLAISERFAGCPVLDQRSLDEIGRDEFGVPH